MIVEQRKQESNSSNERPPRCHPPMPGARSRTIHTFRPRVLSRDDARRRRVTGVVVPSFPLRLLQRAVVGGIVGGEESSGMHGRHPGAAGRGNLSIPSPS